MYYVGRIVKKRAAKAEADEAEYQAASPSGRKAILARHRDELMKAAHAALADEAARRAQASGHQKVTRSRATLVHLMCISPVCSIA